MRSRYIAELVMYYKNVYCYIATNFRAVTTNSIQRHLKPIPIKKSICAESTLILSCLFVLEEYLLLFCSESFVFQFAIQKFKD